MEENVSVVIPTYKRSIILHRLLSSLPVGVEVIVVDDDTLSLAQKRNKGFRLATKDYIMFIDDDNFLRSTSIKNAVEAMTGDVGIVGLLACYDSDESKICDGGSRRNLLTGFTQGLNTNRCIYVLWSESTRPYEVDEVANAFIVKRVVFERIGLFDELRFPIELDEADLCIRARRDGYKVIIAPTAVCFHSSQTYSRVPNFRRPKNAYFAGRNRILFQRKHLARLYRLYLVAFLPVFVISYCVSLLFRKKPDMVKHFLSGVRDGLRNKTESPKEYQS